jgi:hypothetical protein
VGFMDDFRKGQEKTRATGEAGPDGEPKKKGWFASLSTGKQIAVIVGPIIALVILIAIGEGEEEETSSGPSLERVQPTGTIACPRQLFVGVPTDVSLTVKNPGPVSYPSAFVYLDEGFDSFTVNRVSSGNEDGEDADIPGFDPTYRFDQGVESKGSREIDLTLTPIDLGVGRSVR